jgi:CBS domain-containing protein
MEMNVGQACSRPAVSASASSNLMEVASLMRERNVGAIVITKTPLDRPVVVGVITDRDIVQAQLDHTADLSGISAEQVMSRDPLEIGEELPIDEAIQRMRARGVRRAPVVSATGALVGMVSVDDLLASVAEEVVGLAAVLARQPHS